MKKTLEKVLLGFLLIIGSLIYSIIFEGGLGIFILTLLFILSVSILIRIIKNKTRLLPYKIMLGSPVALIVSLLFYILLNYANKNFNFNNLFLFFIEAIQFAILAIVISLILLLVSFVKNKKSNNAIKKEN